MKSVYEAPSSLDAHMILNLLEQRGIHGRIAGEYLPGGVGELPATGLVRVLVDETDQERARHIIREWEAIQPDQEAAKPGCSNGISGFLLGLITGGGMMIWAYNSPLTENGVDYNGDGVLDQKWIYRDNRFSRAEIDRDFDGVADIIYHYDRRGLLDNSRHDDNFDGVFETTYGYRNGVTRSRQSDLDQDGNIDYTAEYRMGIIEEVLILGQGRDSRSKRQKFNMGKLISSEFDIDGDDIYDVAREYDHFEEVKR